MDIRRIKTIKTFLPLRDFLQATKYASINGEMPLLNTTMVFLFVTIEYKSYLPTLTHCLAIVLRIYCNYMAYLN